MAEPLTMFQILVMKHGKEILYKEVESFGLACKLFSKIPVGKIMKHDGKVLFNIGAKR